MAYYGKGTSGQVLTDKTAPNMSTFQAASGGGLSSATVTLTSAQIKALHGTPIQIVAAPGAGKVNIIVNMSAKFTYGGSNVFVAAASQFIEIWWGTTQAITNGVGCITNSILVGSSTLVVPVLFGNLTGLNNGIAAANCENLAINAYNSSGTEISGNAANNNTVLINIVYYVATL